MISNLRWMSLLIFFSLCCHEQKRLAIVIPSYCNAQWYQKNLESLLEQDYDNWYAIYVDDCSSDGTADLVRKFIQERNLESKIKLVANSERKGALANHWIATHMCDDWDIVIQYDGDDWFPNNHVLSFINELYQDPELWLTYGSFEDWPIGKRGYSKPTPQKTVDEKLYRETYWTPGQLRTFYAWVFKKIKLEDLLWDHNDESRGKFYPASCDLAFSYPMMEMVGSHFKYIDDIIYIHNVETPLNDFKVNRVPQIIASNVLLHKAKYQASQPPPPKKPFKGADIFILSDNGFEDCTATLESCQRFVKGIHNIFSVDVAENSIQKSEGKTTYHSMKQLLVKELHNWWKSSEYVLFLKNGMVLTKELDLEMVAQKLESTQAFAYFPTFGVSSYPNVPAVKLNDDFLVWRLCYANQEWIEAPKGLSVFGKKEALRARIAYLTDELAGSVFLNDIFAEGMLLIQDPTISRIGISFEHPCIAMR